MSLLPRKSGSKFDLLNNCDLPLRCAEGLTNNFLTVGVSPPALNLRKQGSNAAWGCQKQSTAHIIHHEFSQGYKMRLWLCGVRISGVSRNLRVRLPDWGYKRDDFRIFSGWER